jgi:hypothetical protein
MSSLHEQAERVLPDVVLIRMAAHGSITGPYRPEPPLLLAGVFRLGAIFRKVWQ